VVLHEEDIAPYNFRLVLSLSNEFNWDVFIDYSQHILGIDEHKLGSK
jgi:hypothetical protein